MNRNSSQAKAKRMALTAMLTTLSLVLLYGASLAPSGRLGLTAAAGLLPAAAVVSCGMPAGFLCYGGTAILALLLLADKNIALLYLAFFGLYPMVKGLAERTGKRVVEWTGKLAFFNAALTLALWLFRTLFLMRFPQLDGAIWLAYLGGNLVFLVYDFGFSRIIALYQNRIAKVLRNW